MTALIFDLDGTLIDSAPAIHAVSNAELVTRGFAPLSLDQVRSFVGRGVPHLVRCLLETSGENPDGPLHGEICATLIERYETQLEGNHFYPGVRAALDQLREDGHRLAICTNKPYGPAEAVLYHLGILDLFEVVIGGDSLPTRKPEPAMLHAAHERLGGGPMIYVGDSEIDADTAANAGAPFALYTEGYRKAGVHDLRHHVAFSNFEMLPGIVANWHWEA